MLQIKEATVKYFSEKDLKIYHGYVSCQKLVEQVDVKQLMQHINSNNLDNPRQSA